MTKYIYDGTKKRLVSLTVHDEESLEEALLLVDLGPVRYSDTFAYIIITNRHTLETRCRAAFGYGDIAIVVPQGMESGMEVHHTELLRVKAQRRMQEKKDIQEYFREHPESVANVEKHAKRRGVLKEKDNGES